jgi:2-polyprenyl-3-methyl-5-hydroxy-6-metoxy-1,4-benzoquinol methylase
MNLISSRFMNDSQPLLHLTRLQLASKQQVDEKVASKRYRFQEVPCVICGMMDFAPLSEKDRYGLWCPVVACRNCGLVQTNPRMDEGSYSEFYNKEYRKLYVGDAKPTAEHSDTKVEKGKDIFKFLQNKKLLSDTAGALVLEVGCGAGGILKHFERQGYRVKGIDIGEEYVSFGRDYFNLDLEAVPLKNLELAEPPDLVIYSHVIEHLLEPDLELEHLARVISNETLVYVEVPGLKRIHKSHRMDFLRYLQNAHTYHFTLVQLRNLFQTHGFELVEGDDYVRAVFRKADSVPSYTSDYGSTLKYLRRLEALRVLYPLTPFAVVANVRRLGGGLLRLLGVGSAAGTRGSS